MNYVEKMENAPQSRMIYKSMRNRHNGKELIDNIQTTYNPKTQRRDLTHSTFSLEKFYFISNFSWVLIGKMLIYLKGLKT